MIPYSEYSDVFQLIKHRYSSTTLRNVQQSIFSTLQRQFYHSDQKLAVLAAPTGSGKSLIAKMSAEYLRLTTHTTPAWYIAPTIHLQQQYIEDFRRFKINNYLFLAGRGVYSCPYLEEKYGVKMNGQPYTANDCIYVTGIRKSKESCPFHVVTARKPVEQGTYPNLIKELDKEGVHWAWFNLSAGWALRYFEDPSQVCPYEFYRVVASRAAHVVTNYDVLLLEWAGNNGPELPVPGLIVFDEAHVLFDKILTRFGTKIPIRKILSNHKIKYSEYVNSISGSKAVMRHETDMTLPSHLSILLRLLHDRLNTTRNLGERYALYFDISNLQTHIRMLLSYPSAYLGSFVDPVRGYIRLKVDPVRMIASFIRKYLTLQLSRPDGVPHGTPPEYRKILVMSGTVGDYKIWRSVADSAGLSKIDWSYHDFSNVGFPPDIRPIYYTPLYPVSRANFVEHIDHFSTIVSATYYELRRFSEQGYYSRPAIIIHAYLRSAAEFLHDSISKVLHDYGEDPASVYLAIANDDTPIREIIDSFKTTGGILVSSTGAAEGVDFKDDLARLQFIFKAPFPGSDYPKDLRDFYTMKTIVQMAGRVARSADDFGATFIVDEYALRHYEEHSDIYPAYYRDAVKIYPRFEEAYQDYRALFQRYVPKINKEVLKG